MSDPIQFPRLPRRPGQRARWAWIGLAVAIAWLALGTPSWAAQAGAHEEPIAAVAAALVVILIAASLGGDLAVRAGQPAVLGELLAGIVLGNLGLIGFHGLDGLAHDASIDLLAGIGVLVLLFEVGLESTVSQMMQVGWSSLLVAVIGVVVPFALGWLVGAWLLPEADAYVHSFLGATLCATSVGITARVLKDMNRSRSPEARVILGAAVIDDVLGLVVLAVVTGAIEAASGGAALGVDTVAIIIAKAVAFLVGALAFGALLTPRLFALGAQLRSGGVLLGMGLSFCFLLSWAAGAIGLAPIVGAFAAGLILEEIHFRPFAGRGEHKLEELIRPIAGFLVPIFFVLMGMRTDLRAFAQPGVLGLALTLTVVAILGKQVCAAGVLGHGLDRLSIGIGMVPRGEVGLIFANVGLGLEVAGERIVSAATYSAVVVMVVLTTLVTPPALRWSMNRADARDSEPRAGK